MKYPLVFTFRDFVANELFAAGVVMQGKLVAERDGDRWWFSGVNPGGVAAEGGPSVHDGYFEFTRNLHRIILEFLREAKDYPHFEAELRSSFHETDLSEQAAWQELAVAIREGRSVEDEGVASLPIKSYDGPCTIEIVQLDAKSAKKRLPPQVNAEEELARLEPAA